MIDREKIKKLYTKKVEKLSKLNKAYFEKDNPIVTDSEFDELKKELLTLVKENPFLKKIKNLDSLIGHKPSAKCQLPETSAACNLSCLKPQLPET